MTRQLVGATKKMHDVLIRRDIKLENVLVSAVGELKICDFGVVTPVKPPSKPYKEGNVGTMIYSSPEQLTGSWYYGTTMIMWALGCIMAELLTDKPLFDVAREDGLLTGRDKTRTKITRVRCVIVHITTYKIFKQRCTK